MKAIQFRNLEIRLAERMADVAAAQALRYRVFFEEMGARPSDLARALSRDVDGFDDICDHLLVIDRDAGTPRNPCVIGTYRLMRRSVAEAHGGFYSEQEFDLGPLLAFSNEGVELGRSCVDPAARARGVMQLLWRGIAEYLNHFGHSLMFGCASFPCTDPQALALPLSYLHHHHRAPRSIRPKAVAGRYVSMDHLAPHAVCEKAAMASLPPLIKGYLRLGGQFGDGAVIDHEFNTTDVLVIVNRNQVAPKYHRHYSAEIPTDARLSA